MTTAARICALLVGSLVLAACGGGGGGSSGGGGGGGGTIAGIGGTGISYGKVNGFGSILVNGRRIEISGATVTLDDNPGIGLNGGIKQGMVVKATGTFSGNTGTATSVVYRDNLEGPVCDAPATVGGIRTLRVLGQTVILDATTFVEDPETIDSIAVNDIVEVSGLPDELERIQTSFIEVKDPAPVEFEVKGRVDTVDGGLKKLTINSLEVDFNLALVDNNIPGGIPAVGQFIEVKGTTYTCGGGTDMLEASKVELEPEGAGAIGAGDDAEIEGFVTSPLSANSFVIGNREVEITGSTIYLPTSARSISSWAPRSRPREVSPMACLPRRRYLFAGTSSWSRTWLPLMVVPSPWSVFRAFRSPLIRRPRLTRL